MNKYKLKYKPLGSIAILIEWPKLIDPKILLNISLFRSKIRSDMGEFVLETVPAYNSLTVFFDTGKIKYYLMVKNIKALYEVKHQKLLSAYKLWKIPVCYDDEFGIDLELIAKTKKLSKEKVIQFHSSTLYDVYFVGFLPGFLYLGGLSEKIHFNRKLKPRLEIKKGDVGIAGNQTGIYPRVSPGGWNIIGNSPINFFDAAQHPPCFVVAGDKIQFIPIHKKEYNKIAKDVSAGLFNIESEVYG